MCLLTFPTLCSGLATVYGIKSTKPGQDCNKKVQVEWEYLPGLMKSNSGHLEGAAGLAGILKAVMLLERGEIPPNALFEKINSEITYP